MTKCSRSSILKKLRQLNCGDSLGSSELAAIGTTVLGTVGSRFDPCYPDCIIHNNKMHFYSVKYWQRNWETLMGRVENGETIGVENDIGERAVMVPADDELITLYKEHEEGS